MQPRCSCTSEPWKFLGVLRCPALNSAGYSIICFSFRVKECPVPTNKELADDDPELLDLMEGGGLQAGTIRVGEEQGREQQLAVITASSQLTRCETNYL